MRIILLVIASGMIFFAGALGFWVSDRTIPSHAQSAFVLTPEVVPGGTLETKRTVDRERLCHTSIERMMFDSRDRRFDLGTAIYPNGAGALGFDEFVGVQSVPEEMELGPARYEAIVCYRCNPIHWIWPVCEPARVTRFTVVAPPPEEGIP